MTALKAIVKSVISGDTLVLRSRAAGPGQPSKDRILHLADITAPRMGSSTREDEPWAYESRENIRALLVGKEVSFTTTHSLPPSTTDAGVQRDIGTVEFNGVDLGTDLLRNGWAKVKEGKKGEPSDEDLKRKDLETEARNAGRGIWRADGPPQRTVIHTMPQDAQAFIKEYKDQIDGIVEQVRDGSTLRVRLLLPEDIHHIVNISLAGIRCARAGGKDGEAAEPWGAEAKFFTESRMLQRQVRVKLLSVPTPAALPFSSTSTNQTPAPPSMFIGLVLHPMGNIAEHLVANGLARVVDWHAGMLSTVGGMERLRAAEANAKEKKLCLYVSSATPTATATKPNGAPARNDKRSFEGTVIRVWSADQISVLEKETGKERRIQFSSTRAPKTSDQAFYAAEAKEFLRKKLVGKVVRVHVDYVKPKEGDFEERDCATVRIGGANTNIAEQVIEKGYATVVRHRRDDEDRSPEFDKLMAAEQAALTEKRGLHSGKEGTVPKVIDASENASRANQYLSGFKRLKRVPGVVDYVAAGSRFRILIPRENVTLTLVLAGIRAPKTARNKNEKSEPYGPEAAAFATHRYMQRDVEVEFESVDKSGGFIGALFLNKTENAAITLVKEGLSTVHAYSAEGLSWSRHLLEAEEEAKAANKGVWTDFTPEEPKPEEVEEAPTKAEYLDVIVSDVRTDEFGFSVQVLNTEGIASLEKLMHEFSLHHKSAPSTPGFMPRTGELVSARFSDGSWYRAKIRRSALGKKEAEVTFIDYGNKDTVSFANIRPLDPKFRALPGQAQDARLSFVKFVSNKNEEYYGEAVNRFRDLCEGRKLIATIDYKEGPLLHLRLINPTDPSSSTDPDASINADLIREGWGTIDKKGTPRKYLANHPSVLKRLEENLKLAKRERLGIFELGDVEDDD